LAPWLTMVNHAFENFTMADHGQPCF